MEDPQKIIRVMIVDDHLVVRRGLATFLLAFDDLELVGEATSGREALERCGEVTPDVILMDMVMPEMNGAEATRLIRQRYPQVQVLALTSFEEENLVQQAFAAGAISYMFKTVSEDELANAIRSASRGQPTLAPEATQALLHAAAKPNSLGANLTDRERQILPMIVEGMSNSQIAERLVVSHSTIRFHVSNILNKLNAANRAEAVAVAVKQKLV